MLALPTHREGIGLVSLEAQASGVPVVTTTATGARDSILDGITGFSVPVGDVLALAEAVAHLLQDSRLRGIMGEAAREWVKSMFDREVLWAEIKKNYVQATDRHGAQLEQR